MYSALLKVVELQENNLKATVSEYVIVTKYKKRRECYLISINIMQEKCEDISMGNR